MGNSSVQIDSELCKACAFCVDVCPVKIIQLSGDANSGGYHYALVRDANKCTACRFCAIMCPEVAIRIEIIRKRK